MMIYLFHELYELTKEVLMNFMNFMKNLGPSPTFLGQPLAANLNTLAGAILLVLACIT
jgi:hypothetical protein